MMGEKEKARLLAEHLPSLHHSREVLLARIFEGEDLLEQAQNNIITHLTHLRETMIIMTNKSLYSPREKVKILEAAEKMYELIFYDGNFGYEHTSLYEICTYMAGNYAILKNRKKTLSALKKALYHAGVLDNFKPGRYTSLFTDKCEYLDNVISRNHEESFTDKLKNLMKADIYDFLCDDTEFLKLSEKECEASQV